MVTPFLNARDFIFQAQNKTDLEEQKLLLQKAFDQLTTATNAVYTDLKTSADHLAKLTIRSFFQKYKTDTELHELFSIRYAVGNKVCRCLYAGVGLSGG